ncbi:MAG TPA: hypothetical protein VGR22_02300, partial [Thermomicrobiales bacterium]|nr:hypothetical protein [Thermomicrobiales bacterium]
MPLLPMAGGAAAHPSGVVVVVWQPDGTAVAVDPHTGQPVPLPVSTSNTSIEAPGACPEHDDSVVLVAGAVRYRQHWPKADAHLLLAGEGEGAGWWYWRRGLAMHMLDLPVDLETAFPSNSCARWFHGALVHADHLGSGTLRLLAVDLATGEMMLDREFDRRLELAATDVSPDGAAVAHLQGGNTRLDLWLADLRGQGRDVELGIPIGPAPVAPAAIDLRVVTDGDRTVAIAGVSWSQPDHPAPFVLLVSVGNGEPVITTVPGEI